MKHIPAPFQPPRPAAPAALQMRPQAIGPGIHWPPPALKTGVTQQRPAVKSAAPPAYRPFAALSSVQPVRAFAPAVVQLMKKKRDKQKKIKQKQELKEEKYLNQNAGVHVEEFHSSTSNLTAQTGAEVVFALATIDGKPGPDASGYDAEADPLITKPDNANDSANTTSDGEVKVLIRALKSFTQFMENDRGANHVNFDLALSDAWGACDGCKKRIGAFIATWNNRAAALLAQGRTARLRVTYRYINAPKTFTRSWGSILYGWGADAINSSPYFHTITQNATGTAT